MDDGRWDLARQVANLVGALFQVAMTVVASAGIQEVVERGPGSLSSRPRTLSRFGL